MSSLTYPNVPLHGLMRAQALRDPDELALWFNGRTLSFAEFDAASNRLAHGLTALHFRAGDRLGLYLPNCPEAELGFYAASKLGAIASPMNPSYREAEIIYQLNDSGASVLLTHVAVWPTVESALQRLETVREIVVVGANAVGVNGRARLYEDVIAGQPCRAPEVRVDPGQLVALPYSSGTTGFPKGVMLTHRNLVANHTQYRTVAGFGPRDAFLMYLPLSHIYGILLMSAALASGTRQVLMERFDLATAVQLIQEHRITWLHVVPPVLLALANAPGLERCQFRSVKFASNAAAPLAPDVARRVEERLGMRVIQAYGLTETSPVTHHSPLELDRIRLESVGVPVPDTEQRIVDIETGERTLPPREVGEIVVRGPQVMQGYWNAPEESARVLRDGWLHTGDIGWIDDEGYVYVVDRKKEMIKSKGFSIAPAQLEAMLLEHPDVADCAVIGAPDVEAGEVPKAFVVARPGRVLNVGELKAFMSARVAGYKEIQQWEIIDNIPRTTSGKILRRVLKQMAEAGAASSTGTSG